MPKIAIYFMPGLAADKEIFEHLNLSSEKYSFHYLKWIQPIDLSETIADYALRLSNDIKEKNPVLVGVSFGGIIVQEMSKFLITQQIILISSVKTTNELPKRIRISKFIKIHKLFPITIVSNFEKYTKYFLGKSLKKRAKIYKKYLSVRDKTYLNWAINNVVNWEQNSPQKNLIHIHGTNDRIFPIKNIENTITINGGTHIMILTKAKEISKIIDTTLTC
jgi:pimeloyl-ACP methyl ester carboxylesterase